MSCHISPATVVVAAVASVLGLGRLPPVAAGPARPNILLILADDLGYGDLGSWGAIDLRTPHLDRLVASGMRLDNFYANSPVCSPTRASLLTGRYPELVGVPGVIRTHPEDSWGHLAPDATLLPELLGRAGYHTALVGKWHLGLAASNRPGDRGLDSFRGFLGDMMDDYYDHLRHGINYMRRDEEVIDPEGHATDLFSEWASGYLRTRVGARAPFFLYLAYNAPHTPIQPPAEWLDRVRQRQPELSERRARLVALIEQMDAGIGTVLATLEEAGLADDTLVVFTSDNGGQLDAGANNGPLRDGKQSMYEGGLKVPFGAVWPGRIAPGRRSDRLALTMDLFPTLCDAADVAIEHTIDGRSLLPTLLGREQPREDRDLFFHRREGNPRYQGLTVSAIRRGDWKLLRNSPFAPLELYNLEEDPREEQDLAATEEEMFRDLAQALRLQVQRGGAVPWQPPSRRDVP
jgi:arylsulfatase A-like enzyme